jgi:hypothetical protein
MYNSLLYERLHHDATQVRQLCPPLPRLPLSESTISILRDFEIEPPKNAYYEHLPLSRSFRLVAGHATSRILFDGILHSFKGAEL